MRCGLYSSIVVVLFSNSSNILRCDRDIISPNKPTVIDGADGGGGHTRTIVIPFNLIHATDEQSHFYEQTNRWLSHLNCSLHKCLFDWVLTLNCCVKIANAESIVYLRNVLFANNALGLRKCLFIFYCFISYSPPNNAIKTRDGDRRVRFKFCQATEIMH